MVFWNPYGWGAQVPPPPPEKNKTLPDMIRDIIYDIKMHGHYKPKGYVAEFDEGLFSSSHYHEGARCLLRNTAMAKSDYRHLCYRAEQAMIERLPIEPYVRGPRRDRLALIRYSDSTPTEQMLADLQRLANDLEIEERQRNGCNDSS